MEETERKGIYERYLEVIGKYDKFKNEAGGLGEFQKLHKEFIEISQAIERNDMYSSNEELKDINDYEIIDMMKIVYFHVKFIDSFGVSSQLRGKSDYNNKRNRLRLLILEIIEGMLFKECYKMVVKMKIFEEDDYFGKIIKKWIENYNELRQESINENGIHNNFIKIEDVNKKTFKGSVDRREFKIEKWKYEKKLNARIRELGDGEGVCEEKLDELKICVVEGVNSLETYAMERDMLGQMTKIRELQEDDEADEEEDRFRMESVQKDDREKDRLFDKGYTDRVEQVVGSNKVVSKDGKILRPFTIVGSQQQKREELQRKVFGTGQVLPTMTVEELVEQELQNGGMVKPDSGGDNADGAADHDHDHEDDYEWQDRATEKQRAWDEFTDTHRKGSGNTKGNLG